MKVNRGYARLLKKLLRNSTIINRFFNEEEWKTHDVQESLTEEKSKHLYQEILGRIAVRKEELDANRYAKMRRMTAVMKYAAAAILICIPIWILFSTQDHPIAPETIVSHQEQQPNIPSPVWEEYRNISKSIQRIVLPDSSVVKVDPKASIRYVAGLKGRYRDIYLSGRAYFQVKKDTARPFSVIAGRLKTTAIGTSFTINSFEKSKVSVMLHTGKILVKPTEMKRGAQAYYLSRPGASLSFNSLSGKIHLIPVSKTVQALPVSRLSFEGGVLSMENIPMAKVLQLLGDAYHVQIVSDPAVIANITYTGEVDTNKEAIAKVLEVIALINSFTVTQQNEQLFYISK